MLPKVYGIQDRLAFSMFHDDIVWAVNNHYVCRLILFQHFKNIDFPIYFNGWGQLTRHSIQKYSIKNDNLQEPLPILYLQEIAVDLRKLENYVWTSRT